MTTRKYPKRPWVSAHAIIFDQHRRILLVKRAAPPKQNFWFPPGGAIDVGETVKSGLEREILEETNVTVKNMNFVDYIDGITQDTEGQILYHFVVFMFVADYLEGTIKAKDDALEVRWVSLEEIMTNALPVPKELITILERLHIEEC
ncbi:MAG: NUDIX domain-containing protein [Candidatus Heimdallarchaeota archaeon]|nr:MAG: NUDIX domain-containing protein [Candidatus Heimdallarchaeota archaeon]